MGEAQEKQSAQAGEMISGSNLEKVFRSGQLAVTTECGPPKGADVEHLIEKINHIKGNCDAANVTDNQTAVVRMSSIAASAICVREGVEPIMQMVTRDRNRIAAQSDVFGAYALGIRNMLCLTGDHQKFGNHPTAKNVFDLDSIQLLKAVKTLRDDAKTMGGEDVQGAPKMFLGAAANPFGDPFEFRVPRLAKKVKAGASFIQTQCIYDMDRFKRYMQQVCDRGLDKQVYIMAGITPLKSAGMANYMNKFVAGISIPDEIIARIKGVPKEKQTEEGIKICVEQIQEVQQIPGIAGIHLMAIEWEHKVKEILEMAKLLPRPIF